GADEVANCQPILESMPGWTASTVGVATMDALPVAARAYLERIEELCGVPIDIVSTGPERSETIVRRHPLG
ncbi:MAG TPA: adenylosuccinate synthetase, partial [Accumulibacter sp.]|uniref:adenylosuccinate synthetase n=1 Tax=Accumulibacter sp. TaxID=2053492 RepID=UPI002BBA3AB0